ncbi:hypothetical protein QOT17_015205 [Balamuthia mandrillaris]
MTTGPLVQLLCASLIFNALFVLASNNYITSCEIKDYFEANTTTLGGSAFEMSTANLFFESGLQLLKPDNFCPYVNCSNLNVAPGCVCPDNCDFVTECEDLDWEMLVVDDVQGKKVYHVTPDVKLSFKFFFNITNFSIVNTHEPMKTILQMRFIYVLQLITQLIFLLLTLGITQ